MVDPVITSCILGLLGKHVIAPAVSKIVESAMGSVSATARGEYPQAITINIQNQYHEMMNESGIYYVSAPEGLDGVEEPSYMSGGFISDDSLGEFADFSSVGGKIVMLIADLSTEDVSLLHFGSEGYEMGIWPGNYLIYALIIDPISEEIFGFGYPCLDDLVDLNPLDIPSGQELELDFIFTDIAYLEQYI